MVLCCGSIKSKGISLSCPLVYNAFHVLSESPDKPLYESGTLDILSKSPKEPLYESETLDYREVTGDMTTMFAYV